MSIAGSDPGGGAGIQADLKTFHRFGVFGAAAVTLITVQNTRRLSRVEVLDPALVSEQIEAVLEDLPPDAVKTGALGNEAVAECVAACKFNCPLIVDPVMIGKHGARLMAAAGWGALLARADLITPNLHEASVLAGMPVETVDQMRKAAPKIGRSVLIKGGHLEGDAVDILWHDGVFTEFSFPRIQTRHTHGTGCTYSAAITACVAKGMTTPDAVRTARRFIQNAIETNPGLGSGSGPLNHWASL